MSDLGLGIIGSGFMGLTYAEVLTRHIKGARLVAVAGGKRAEQLAGEYQVPAESNIEKLLARPDLQGVVLATPDNLHCEQVIAAAEAGKHVLVEKPMAPTVAECDRMIAACTHAGVNLAVVQTERYRKLTLRAKELVDDGAIGPIWMMRTISAFPRSLTDEILSTRDWMNDPKSGGLFMGIAAHNTDFLRWISGRNAVRVYAQVATFSDLKAPAQSVMAQIEFEGGVMGHMWISSEFPAPSLPSSEVRFQIIGSKGILDFENFEFLDLGKSGQWERVYVPEKFDYLKEPKSAIRLVPHIGVIQEFVDSVNERRPPRVGGAEGRAAVELCEACLISARLREPVDLPLSGEVTA
ncbi:MAG: Gfo/Idh/MocA family oxidoreductase [Planctomycetales bacterium]